MDAQQFKQLVLPHSRRMRLLALRLTGDADDAADAVQDALARLWSRRSLLHKADSVEAYALTTVRHCCAEITARRRHVAVDLAEAPEETTSPDEEFDRTELLVRLRHAIGGLPPGQQRVMRLHDLEQYSVKEIEELTGFSAGNIRVLLSRARHKIKSLSHNIC